MCSPSIESLEDDQSDEDECTLLLCSGGALM